MVVTTRRSYKRDGSKAGFHCKTLRGQIMNELTLLQQFLRFRITEEIVALLRKSYLWLKLNKQTNNKHIKRCSLRTEPNSNWLLTDCTGPSDNNVVLTMDTSSPLRPDRTSFRRLSVVIGYKDGETKKWVLFVGSRENNFIKQSIWKTEGGWPVLSKSLNIKSGWV